MQNEPVFLRLDCASGTEQSLLESYTVSSALLPLTLADSLHRRGWRHKFLAYRRYEWEEKSKTGILAYNTHRYADTYYRHYDCMCNSLLNRSNYHQQSKYHMLPNHRCVSHVVGTNCCLNSVTSNKLQINNWMFPSLIPYIKPDKDPFQLTTQVGTLHTEEIWMPVKLLNRLRITSALTGESFMFVMDVNLIFKITSNVRLQNI